MTKLLNFLKMEANMRCTIVIDGESAEDLFAVGPVDLRTHFLPKDLHVNEKDIVRVTFAEGSMIDGTGTVHKDNYVRDEDGT